MTDPFDAPEWREYAEHARRDLIPKLRASAATVSLVPGDGSQSDIKFAVELGLSIMLDKPIIALVQRTRVPDKLAGIADAIVEGDPGEVTTGLRIKEALDRILGAGA